MSAGIPDYGYSHTQATWDNAYLVEPALALLAAALPQGAALFELGCGNGHFAGLLQQGGYRVTAADPSETGISVARAAHPGIRFENIDPGENLAARFGQFEAVVSLEVIEHCYSAQSFMRQAAALLQPGGMVLISTPYHGYWKNLALALTGRLPQHMNPLWEGGHIKFFTARSLSQALAEAGFVNIRIHRSGRWPLAFAKSMIAVAYRPTSEQRP